VLSTLAKSGDQAMVEQFLTEEVVVPPTAGVDVPKQLQLYVQPSSFPCPHPPSLCADCTTPSTTLPLTQVHGLLLGDPRRLE
jgi:hypothetical protein